MKLYIISACLLSVVVAQRYSEYTTPVPILKQINRHNEDGSYSYGYEAADGTYKIESKYPNGEVFGKYGYVDDTGAIREIEYGASRRGFEPAGNEINVAPPTLVSNYPQAQRTLGPNEEDDGQYREDPKIYYQNDYPDRQYSPSYYEPSYQSEPSYRPRPAYRPPSYNSQPTYNSQPAYNPQPTYNPQPASYNPRPAYQPSYVPSYNNYASQPRYHPATGVDYFSGSYSVNY